VNNLAAGKPEGTITQRLRTKFGVGAQPVKRMALYRRLEWIVDKHGDRAYQIISETIALSVDLDYPDRYFCRTVSMRFKELGWWNPVVPW
jgi:hypothetical protein